ncbi:MAG TPA: restriction endonuclease [Saprospiraceae bacterium]|nr:restriction endonuclease [Saprospiraceae bacterium]
MTFPPPDPRRFLLESIPDRFRHLSPEEFSDFIRYLFQLDGYTITSSLSSTDFGPHIKAIKDNMSLVILPVLFKDEQEAGQEIIQRAKRAKDLYQAEQAWVIINTAFTKEAMAIAREEDLELWDWEALYEGICQLFFEGKSHLVYQPAPVVSAEPEDGPPLKLKVKWEPQEGVTTSWYNLELMVTNPTDRHIFVHFDMPVIIDQKKTQWIAEQWGEDDFKSGMVYAGATILTNAQFKASKLGERPPGGKVILTCHERGESPLTYHLTSKLKGDACFIVTFCYGTGSLEYHVMCRFRDEFLKHRLAGRWFISVYYLISPFLVEFANHHKVVAYGLRALTRVLVWMVNLVFDLRNSASIHP